MKVRVKEFMRKYMSAKYGHGSYIPGGIFSKIISHTETYIDLPDNIIEIIEEQRIKEKNWEKLYKTISAHRIKGMDKEGKQDINGAIDEYSKSIEIGETTDMFHAYAYSYERIIILLHKVKDYNQEAKYITQLLKHRLNDKRREKYQNRLEKLNSKLNK